VYELVYAPVYVPVYVPVYEPVYAAWLTPEAGTIARPDGDASANAGSGACALKRVLPCPIRRYAAENIAAAVIASRQ
jgi:hypothetical protein